MTAYYNENDPYAAEWVRELIRADLIPPGDVDERRIEDVTPNEVRGYAQCHFFAGIGGWAYALDLAGWPRDRPVWTGSCPCQPFSAAGKGNGFADERHLWPAWQHLIAQCRPPVVFGEQVASKHADPWVDLVHADMEGMGYAFGSLPFPSAGIGAPHIRDRNYWVADLCSEGLAQRVSNGRFQREAMGASSREAIVSSGDSGGMADARRSRLWSGQPGSLESSKEARAGEAGQWEWLWPNPQHGGTRNYACSTNGHWRTADWLACRDGKWRPVEPGTFPLAHGIPARVVRLRGYGNAINPEAAAQFIQAYCEERDEVRLAA